PPQPPLFPYTTLFRSPDRGFEAAWKVLMDKKGFFAEYGPTTVERGDPLFHLSPHCCWWSGQSWPYATSQTLKAMANLLQRYDQEDRKSTRLNSSHSQI